MFKPKKSNTWLEYIDQIAAASAEPQQLQVEGFEKLLLLNQSFNSFFYHSIPIIYLLDYTTGKYMFMSNSSRVLLGYPSNIFTEHGIGFTIEAYHPEDLKLYNEKMFPDRLQILNTIPPPEHPNHVFSYSFRLKNNDGDYVNLLQRSCFIKSDNKGLPLMSIGMVMNVQHFSQSNPVVQTVEKINPAENTCQLVYKKEYHQQDEHQLFSRREKEILLWMAEGLTSKEIADKLYISEHTIINHRKNMQQKSGTGNVASLISYCFRNHII